MGSRLITIAAVKGVRCFITAVLAIKAKDVATTARTPIYNQLLELILNRSAFIPPLIERKIAIPMLADKSSTIEILLGLCFFTKAPLSVLKRAAINADTNPKVIPRV